MTPHSSLDFNQIKLIPALLKDYPLIQNMGRFYVYDMSEFMGSEPGWEMPEDGMYECIPLKKYWEAEGNFPFIVRYQDEIAGFVIIDKKGSEVSVDFNVAQFFILRKFKNKGLGRFVAHQCFDKFRGVWEVMVMPGNVGADRFWQSTVQSYTKGAYADSMKPVAHFNHSVKHIFTFSNVR